ncbi:MAG: Gldg family protein, partial [Planctomycetota bacterium]
MATNKTARDWIAVVAVVVALGATVLANQLSERKFARWDLTSEKKFSLSDPFRRILDKLDDTATLTYYISGHVPSWFEVTKRDILDKLREIEQAGKGHVVL